MEGIELVCFEIISAVGGARSCYVEAIQKAKAKDFEGAQKLVEEGDGLFQQGHQAHAKLITQEANGDKVDVVLLLVHAEDQLMSAEAFKILANEFIDVYKNM